MTAARAEQNRYLHLFPLVETDFGDGPPEGFQRDQTQRAAGKEGGVQKDSAVADHLLLNLQQRGSITIFEKTSAISSHCATQLRPIKHVQMLNCSFLKQLLKHRTDLGKCTHLYDRTPGAMKHKHFQQKVFVRCKKTDPIYLLTPDKDFQSKALVFCRIVEYISLDLFHFVNLTSSCSLIPWIPNCCRTERGKTGGGLQGKKDEKQERENSALDTRPLPRHLKVTEAGTNRW